MSLTRLPILDLSRADDPALAADFHRQLRETTHDVGFFYLTGHGIPAAEFSAVLDIAERFFALPEAEKLAIANTRSPHFRGYTRIGGERTGGRVDWREQIDIGPERSAIPAPAHAYDRLTGPNLYPAGLPELKEVAERWHAALSTVGERLLRAWAVSLGQPADIFAPAFATAPESFLKIVRYPGPPAAESAAVAGSARGISEGERTQGVGEHRDAGVLTLLYPQPGSTGLQVRYNDRWIDVEPIENTFVVNIGKLLEVATDGYLRATVHRVLPSPPGTDRISVPFFYNPALSASLPHLELPAELAAAARGVSADERDVLHAVYGDNALASRLRSHPDVAARHHPDLLAAGSAPEAVAGSAGTAREAVGRR